MASNYKLKLTVLQASEDSAPLGRLGQTDSQHSMLLDQSMPGANNGLNQEIILTAKNTSTLDEFTCKTFFQTEFISKLQKWISKKRFQCQKAGDKELTVVVEIFSFALQKIERNENEILKDEFRNLEQLSDKLDQEVKLFNYQFFSTSWSDQARKSKQETLMGEQSRRDIIDSIASSFNRYEVLGYQPPQEESGDQQPMCILAKEQFSVGLGGKVECLISEVSESGQGQMSLVNLAKNPSATVTLEDQTTGINQQYMMYEILDTVQVQNQQKYQLSISKLIC